MYVFKIQAVSSINDKQIFVKKYRFFLIEKENKSKR